MKKTLAILTIICLTCSMLLTGCGQEEVDTEPLKEPVTAFMDDMTDSEYEDVASQLVSGLGSDDIIAGAIINNSYEPDESLVDLDQSEKEIKTILKESHSKMTYTIEDASFDEDVELQGTVTVSVKYVDAESVVQAVFEILKEEDGSEELANLSEEEFDELVAEMLKSAYESFNEDIQYAEEDMVITMSNTDDGWRMGVVTEEMEKMMSCNMSDTIEKAFGTE